MVIVSTVQFIVRFQVKSNNRNRSEEILRLSGERVECPLKLPLDQMVLGESNHIKTTYVLQQSMSVLEAAASKKFETEPNDSRGCRGTEQQDLLCCCSALGNRGRIEGQTRNEKEKSKEKSEMNFNIDKHRKSKQNEPRIEKGKETSKKEKRRNGKKG